MVGVRLGAPGCARCVEVVCSLPLVVPADRVRRGVSTVLRWGADVPGATAVLPDVHAIQNPSFPIVLVLAYVMMALPFVYRALDAGLRALDVRTLVEAARNCGRVLAARAASGWCCRTCARPCSTPRSSTLALVLGEFTVAQLLGFQPFAVWIVQFRGTQAQLSVAVSVLSLLLTWLLLSSFTARRTRRDPSTRKAQA